MLPVYHLAGRRSLGCLALLVCLICLPASLPAQGPAESSSLPDSSPTDLPDGPTPQNTSSSTQSPQPSAAGAPQDEAARKKQQQAEAQRQLEEEERQHLLGVVPTYNAVNTGNALPLNAKQKFHLAFRSATNPFNIGLAAFVAGIGQAQDSYPEYGQGAEGYFKRFGAGYADSFDGTMLGNALFPVILHQDPRYYRLGTGSFKKRFFYSILSAARCKGDNGKWQPNYSNLLGNIAAGGISNLYYPESDRGVGLTFKRGLIVTAEGAFGGLLLEFAPDIQKHFVHKKQPPATTPPPPAPPASAETPHP